MSRLIDDVSAKKAITDYLMKCVDNNKFSVDVTEVQIAIINIINGLPTAYDVEKVIEELACNSRFIDDINEHNIKCISCVIGQKTAIDIVKRGGVE